MKKWITILFVVTFNQHVFAINQKSCSSLFVQSPLVVTSDKKEIIDQFVQFIISTKGVDEEITSLNQNSKIFEQLNELKSKYGNDAILELYTELNKKLSRNNQKQVSKNLKMKKYQIHQFDNYYFLIMPNGKLFYIGPPFFFPPEVLFQNHFIGQKEVILTQSYGTDLQLMVLRDGTILTWNYTDRKDAVRQSPGERIHTLHTKSYKTIESPANIKKVLVNKFEGIVILYNSGNLQIEGNSKYKNNFKLLQSKIDAPILDITNTTSETSLLLQNNKILTWSTHHSNNKETNRYLNQFQFKKLTSTPLSFFGLDLNNQLHHWGYDRISIYAADPYRIDPVIQQLLANGISKFITTENINAVLTQDQRIVSLNSNYTELVNSLLSNNNIDVFTNWNLIVAKKSQQHFEVVRLLPAKYTGTNEHSYDVEHFVINDTRFFFHLKNKMIFITNSNELLIFDQESGLYQSTVYFQDNSPIIQVHIDRNHLFFKNTKGQYSLLNLDSNKNPNNIYLKPTDILHVHNNDSFLLIQTKDGLLEAFKNTFLNHNFNNSNYKTIEEINSLLYEHEYQ